jgi:dihydrolipoamide dehydrogenase
MQIGIIGGGPAGYSAAIRLSEKGNKVYMFEREKIGGVCLNAGCIPAKSIIHSANLYDIVKSYKKKANWGEIQEKKALAVKRDFMGLRSLLARNKIKIVKKEATLKSDGRIEADGEYSFDKVIVATGSKPIMPKFKVPKGLWGSTEALETEKLPGSLVIIGAGYIGLEFGYLFSCMGSKVSVIEKEDEVLPGEDKESAGLLRKSIMKKGIKFYLSSEVIEVKKESKKFKVIFKNNNRDENIEGDKVLIAIGRKPNTDNLPEEILWRDKVVKVNDFLETKIRNVYAAGDCIGGYLLAHAAFKDAEIAVRNIFGSKIEKDKFSIPRVVYTDPELASVGKSEEMVKSDCQDYMVSKVAFASNPRAVTTGKTRGQMKLIYTKKGRIIGSTIIGENASEFISLIGFAIDKRLGVKELSETVFPHPTFSEIIGKVSSVAEVQAV